MPNGRKFRGGEFETLYRQLPIIRFDLGRNGISPIAAVIVDHVVKTINLRHPRLQLKVASLDLQSRPSAVFTVPNAKDASTALTQIRFEYEKRMAILEAKTSGRRRPAP